MNAESFREFSVLLRVNAEAVRTRSPARAVPHPGISTLATCASPRADRVQALGCPAPVATAVPVCDRTAAGGLPRAGEDALARSASVCCQREPQVATDRAVRVADRRIEQQPDFSHRSAQRAIRVAVEQRLTASALEVHHPAQQHRLSGPGAAEHSGHLPGTHIEAHRVENCAATSPYRQVDGFDHAWRLLDIRCCPVELTSLRSSGAGDEPDGLTRSRSRKSPAWGRAAAEYA
ncbi:MAG TPA: hypothetical protein VFA06_17730 [Actinocrinis sp.]|nr:hypothetical protein [Actinocrinis sp.]HZU57717.1 hypothetical protein [Actinocrinis sp.]